MAGGYIGKVLFVDLSTGLIKEEVPAPAQVIDLGNRYFR